MIESFLIFKRKHVIEMKLHVVYRIYVLLIKIGLAILYIYIVYKVSTKNIQKYIYQTYAII